MEWKEGNIEGVQLRSMARNSDNRGWLAEFFREDEIDHNIMPSMGYISVTHAGDTRGPHEHCDQTDFFAFPGPGDFRVKMWDNRPDSPTYGNLQTVVAGESSPMTIILPPGVVHGYTNISEIDAYVINVPNRLFAGKGKKQPVDEIRHENKQDTPFLMG
ncbi:dTDP-4-dehydrorhamnose 3,5-epimerase family protein [Verrucomicrobiota bacterium]